MNPTINIDRDAYMMDEFGTQPITATNVILSARLLEQTSMAIDLAGEDQKPMNIISNRSSNRKDETNFNIQTSSYPLTHRPSVLEQ